MAWTCLRGGVQLGVWLCSSGKWSDWRYIQETSAFTSREDMGVSEFGQVPGEQKQLSPVGGTERIL